MQPSGWRLRVAAVREYLDGVLLDRQGLVTEEDHRVLAQRRPDFGDNAIIQVVGDVDSENLGAAGPPRPA